MRPSGRAPEQMRPISFTPNFTMHAEGSVLVAFGNTKVICTASDRGPAAALAARRKPGLGNRRVRHAAALHPQPHGARGRARRPGRAHHGDPAPDRSRAARLGRPEEARPTHRHTRLRRDPGRRRHAHRVDLRRLRRAQPGADQAAPGWGPSSRIRLLGNVASVSVGIYNGTPVLDLDYAEDSSAETDMNVVMDDQGRFIEVQGTAEGAPFSARRDECHARIWHARASTRSSLRRMPVLNAG